MPFNACNFSICQTSHYLRNQVIGLVMLQRFAFLIAVASLIVIGSFAIRATSVPNTSAQGPVVVELFTSEGCSSCPPADALLQKFDRQPFSGAHLIVLSEHVDYWNHIGWKDPYSAAAFSDRQSAYGNHLRLGSVYTPQMIVDGADEFVGSNSGDAQNALEKAALQAKIPVKISGLRREGGVLKAQVETGALPSDLRRADVVVAVALDRAESQVSAGENAGHRLTHVAVVRALVKAGSVGATQSFSKEISVPLDKDIAASDLRVIAFLQEPGPGRIRGAALEKLAH
jgi:hypothetical protein